MSSQQRPFVRYKAHDGNVYEVPSRRLLELEKKKVFPIVALLAKVRHVIKCNRGDSCPVIGCAGTEKDSRVLQVVMAKPFALHYLKCREQLPSRQTRCLCPFVRDCMKRFASDHYYFAGQKVLPLSIFYRFWQFQRRKISPSILLGKVSKIIETQLSAFNERGETTYEVVGSATRRIYVGITWALVVAGMELTAILLMVDTTS
jgi:hypothetical protein